MIEDISILYVEDDDSIRENMARPLKSLSQKLYIAHNGEEGIKLYKKHHPDIVVSDIKMPKKNGIQMCKEIKKIDEDQHIILITAHSEIEYFIDAIEMQIDAYILKPVDYKLLKKKLFSIIENISLKRKLLAQKTLTEEIAKLQDNLLAVLDENQNIIFCNDNFLKFFDIADRDEFVNKHGTIQSRFLEGEGFFTPLKNSKEDWATQILKIKRDKRVIALSKCPFCGKRIFLVSINQIETTGHTIITFTEITHISIENKKFKYKAFTDELTGIYNRAFFDEMLKKEFAKFKREQNVSSLIMFDIDFFKKLNDTYGHQTGDEILKELANIVKKQIRSTDIFARWGGEEFMIILPGVTLQNSVKTAYYLKEAIKKHHFVNDIRISCSFGVAQIENGDDMQTLINRVDEVLYKAKKNGRDRVEIS